MFYNFRSDNEIDQFAIVYIQKNKRQGMRTSLSGLFKHLRKIKDLDYFGDFTILSRITKIDTNLVKSTRYGLKMSNELSKLSERDKKRIIRCLSQI